MAGIIRYSELWRLCRERHNRHTFGSQLATKGESLYKISALMGNSPEICRRHYAALMPETLAQSVEFDSTTTK
jgi:hypothetical protein